MIGIARQGKPFMRKNNGNPLLIAHRGQSGTEIQGTLPAFKSAYYSGFQYLEFDCQLLADGNVAVFHDTTVDAITNGTGNLNTFSTETYKNLICDYDGLDANAPVVNPLLLSELLDWAIETDCILVPEVKDSICCNAILYELNKRGYPKDRIIFQGAGSPSSCAQALADGWTCGLIYAVQPGDPAAVRALGYTHIFMDYTAVTANNVTALHNAGLMVWAWTINRRVTYDLMKSYGCDGVFADDVMYISRQYVDKHDNYLRNRWAHGVIPGGTGGTWSKGSFSGGVYTLAETSGTVYRGALQGYLTPIKGDDNCNAFTLTATINFAAAIDANKFVGFHICANNDNAFTDSASTSQTGYHVLVRKSGTVQIYRTQPGSSATKIAETAGSELSLSTNYVVTITVTPTAITAECNSVTATASDSTYRGGYVHFGTYGATVGFSNINVQ